MSDEKHKGWGQDFDDGKNISGEPPSQKTDNFFDKYWKYLIGVWFVWFISNIIRILPDGGASISIAAVMGAMFGSAVFAIVVVGAWSLYHKLVQNRSRQ